MGVSHASSHTHKEEEEEEEEEEGDDAWRQYCLRWRELHEN
jgi:hypothetical protein